jgi:hypothetical protein
LLFGTNTNYVSGAGTLLNKDFELFKISYFTGELVDVAAKVKGPSKLIWNVILDF